MPRKRLILAFVFILYPLQKISNSHSRNFTHKSIVVFFLRIKIFQYVQFSQKKTETVFLNTIYLSWFSLLFSSDSKPHGFYIYSFINAFSNKMKILYRKISKIFWRNFQIIVHLALRYNRKKINESLSDLCSTR